MVKDDLLSNTGLSSTCYENAVNDNPDIHNVLDLLVIQNTPEILSEEQLSEKIKKIEYSPFVSDEEKKQYQTVLLQLSQLPTGKKLISMMPDDVVFGQQINTTADGRFTRETKTIQIDFRLPEIRKCEAIAHEIRHAIQYKYDPTFDGKTTYDFEKIIELDAKLQNFRINKEYTDLVKDDALSKANQSWFSDYYQYQDYLKEAPEILSESKFKIVDTLYAIDVWYGISNNFWRNYYNDQAVENTGFSKNKNQQIEGRKYSTELDKQVKQAYIDNMKVGLPIEFFERDKDCSVVVDGYKLFERKNDDFGCSITLFFKNGKPSYQTRLDKFGWKRHETYFYEDGLKRSEYQYDGGNYALRCGKYTKYYDSISQSGEQHVRERGNYEREEGGYGFVYAEDDEKQQLEKRTYYSNGRLASTTTLFGPEKGKFTSFYDSGYRNIKYRMSVDENGIGQGYFERYRDDISNSLEWNGQQVNNYWNGVCQKHSVSGNVSEEVSFNMGEEGSIKTYFSDTGQKEKEVIYDKKNGWIYQNDFSDNGDCVQKSRYYANGNIERRWCCAGEKKGECFVYYNNPKHRVMFRMVADENGVGQGYFERYRDDSDNILEMSGYQKDGFFDGPCKYYTQDGRLDYECVFKNGKELGYEEGKAYLEKWEEKQQERKERKGLCAKLEKMSQQMQPTQLRQEAKRELVKDFRKMYPKKGDGR